MKTTFSKGRPKACIGPNGDLVKSCLSEWKNSHIGSQGVQVAEIDIQQSVDSTSNSAGLALGTVCSKALFKRRTGDWHLAGSDLGNLIGGRRQLV